MKLYLFWKAKHSGLGGSITTHYATVMGFLKEREWIYTEDALKQA